MRLPAAAAAWIVLSLLVVGAAAGVLLIYAGWPWIWGDPLGQLAITYSHWATYVPKEFFLGVQRVLPVWYYGFAFVESFNSS